MKKILNKNMIDFRRLWMRSGLCEVLFPSALAVRKYVMIKATGIK
jgi:hypothetical protein